MGYNQTHRRSRSDDIRRHPEIVELIERRVTTVAVARYEISKALNRMVTAQSRPGSSTVDYEHRATELASAPVATVIQSQADSKALYNSTETAFTKALNQQRTLLGQSRVDAEVAGEANVRQVA